MSVRIDGSSGGIVNAYNAGARRSGEVVYSTEDLSLGLHALKITKVSGKYMLLDSLAVYGAVAGPDMNCDVADHCTSLGNIVN